MRVVWLSLILLQFFPLHAVSTEIYEPSPPLIALGKTLFHDPRISGSGQSACSHCHNLKHAGADPRGGSLNEKGELLRRNAPSIYNLKFKFRLGWDGRASTLEEQIELVMNNQNEMGASWERSIQRLSADPYMREQFQQLFGTEITKEGVIAALVAFQTSLTALNSAYDRYLAGDRSAFNQREREGYHLFQLLGCDSCHDGDHLGGTQFQHIALFFQRGSDLDLVKFGQHKGSNNYQFSEEDHDYDHNQKLGAYADADAGRYEVTGEEEDLLVFRVPSLRNVALTAPYFHNGSAATLEKAVFEMAEYELGMLLSDDQIDLLVAFLNTLSDDQFLEHGGG